MRTHTKIEGHEMLHRRVEISGGIEATVKMVLEDAKGKVSYEVEMSDGVYRNVHNITPLGEGRRV